MEYQGKVFYTVTSKDAFIAKFIDFCFLFLSFGPVYCLLTVNVRFKNSSLLNASLFQGSATVVHTDLTNFFIFVFKTVSSCKADELHRMSDPPSAKLTLTLRLNIVSAIS